MDSKSERWALFWCSLLGDLLFEELAPHERGRRLREIASTPIPFPDGKRRKPSLSTLRRKLKRYKKSGFDALERKRRSDLGKARRDRDALIIYAIEVKKDQPWRSHRAINLFLEERFGRTLPRSTLYRHLRHAGATRRRLGATSQPVRKTWDRDYTHALWIGDYSHGPYIVSPSGHHAPTRLSVFIDIFSRYLVEARYFLNEKLDTLCDSMVRAVTSHGAPRAVYVDNAKVYHADAFKAFCLRADIKLLHRKPKEPEGGGAIERAIQTIQDDFEKEVRRGKILTLEQLNRAFQAWITVSYHESNHDATNEAPRRRMERGLRARRNVDLQAAVDSFYKSQIRVVHRDYSDVQVAGVLYRVDQKLRTLRVEVRIPIVGDGDTVLIYDQQGCYLGEGKRHRREEGERVSPATPSPAQFNYLELLEKKHQQRLHEQAQDIQYSKLPKTRMTSTTLLIQLARYLGRRGLSDFSTAEVEAVVAFLATHVPTAPLVARAVERSTDKTIRSILRILATLLSKGA